VGGFENNHSPFLQKSWTLSTNEPTAHEPSLQNIRSRKSLFVEIHGPFLQKKNSLLAENYGPSLEMS